MNKPNQAHAANVFSGLKHCEFYQGFGVGEHVAGGEQLIRPMEQNDLWGEHA
jgi:hypothetical protein